MNSSNLPDLLAFAGSALLVVAYQTLLRRRCRQDPRYSIQQRIAVARRQWVESVIAQRRDLLAVQTLRNSIMAASFLASTAVLLVIGVLTLSERGDGGGGIWHSLNVFGQTAASMWAIKILVMLLDLMVAFFSFALAIRLFHHVGYLINVADAADSGFVAAQLDRAGRFYGIGTRAYFLLLPQLFWLFGPHFLAAATVFLIWLLYHLDRNPATDEDLTG